MNRVCLVLLAVMVALLIAAPAHAFGRPWTAGPAVTLLSTTPSVWESAIDEDPPTVQIDSGPDAFSASSSAEFTFSADEPATFECSLDDLSFVACTSPHTLHDLVDHEHRLRVRASDPAGNDGAIVSYMWVSDVMPPDPFDLGVDPFEGAVVTPSSVFDWRKARDATSGVSRYELLVDGAAVATVAECCEARPDAPLTEGAHRWAVRAVDRAGNSRETASRTIVIDAGPPEPFALQAPVDGAYATTARPQLTWDAARDTGAGVNHYVVTVDGKATSAGESTSFTPDADLAEGPHVWHVDAFDDLGNVRSSDTRAFKVDLTPPAASLRDGGSGLAVTGAPVTFDASGSADSVGPLTDFAWDLDGDGTFETDTGAAPTALRSFPSVGDLRIAVRVTDAAGRTATATVPLSVRLAPPSGTPGVSIDGGAIYTNQRDVTLTLSWPQFALDMAASNDGGFAGAQTVPLAPEIPWRLASSGTERLPKTVYVHYRDGLGADKAFQDDIILDETAPTVSAASTNGSGRGLRLRVRAHDAVSGVATLQLARDRSAPQAPRPFKATIVVHRAPRYVRIRDAAGNPSRWHRVATVTPPAVRTRVRAALRRLATGPLRLTGHRLKLTAPASLPRGTTITVVARSAGHRIGSRRIVSTAAPPRLAVRLTRVPSRLRLTVAITPPVGPTQHLTRTRRL